MGEAFDVLDSMLQLMHDVAQTAIVQHVNAIILAHGEVLIHRDILVLRIV